MKSHFHFSRHKEFRLPDVTLPVSESVAGQQYQSIPSGFWDAPHQVPQTDDHPGSSGVLERDVLSLWEGLSSSRPHLIVHPQERCGKRGCHKNCGKKSWLLHPSSTVTSFPVLLFGRNAFFDLFLACRNPSYYSPHPSPCSAPAAPWHSWPHPYKTRQLPSISSIPRFNPSLWLMLSLLCWLRIQQKGVNSQKTWESRRKTPISISKAAFPGSHNPLSSQRRGKGQWIHQSVI